MGFIKKFFYFFVSGLLIFTLNHSAFASVSVSECGGAFKNLTPVASAPALTLEDLVKTRAGKPVNLYFWATWCPDCLEKLQSEIPAKYAADPQGVIMVNVDEDVKRLEAFLARKKITIPMYREKDLLFKKLYKITSVPTTLTLKMVEGGCALQ